MFDSSTGRLVQMFQDPSFWRFGLPLQSRQQVVWRYGGAVFISLAFIGLRWLMGRVIDDGVPFAILFIPIAVSAFYGGFGPGLVSVLTTIAFADYFLIPPLYTLGLPDTRAVIATLLFSISGLIVSALGEVSRNAVLQTLAEAEVSKLAQRQFVANEERLHIAEQVISGGVWDWDFVTHTVYWTTGYRRLLDYPLDETPSREKWEASIHPDDREHILRQLDEFLCQRLHNWSLGYRIRTASGRTRFISSHGQAFYDAGGKPLRMVGIDLDISARRFADASLRDAELRTRVG